MESSNKTSGSADNNRYEKKASLLRRTYTTRQVMELTELRRRQQALLEEAAKISEAPPAPVVEPAVTSSRVEIPDIKESETPSVEKTVWQELPATTSRISETVMQQDDPVEIVDPGIQTPITIEMSAKRWFAKPLAHIQSFLSYLGQTVMDGVLTAGAFILFVVMLTHIMSLGASATRYEQGPFLMLAAVLTLWFQRSRLYRGNRAFGLGVVSFIMGVTIFSMAALQSLLYLEILGFVLTSAGIFCARYTRQTATRMLPALLCLTFAVEPTAFLTATALVPLNHLIAQIAVLGADILHFPVYWQGNVLNAGGYEFQVDRDSTALRMLAVTIPLAILYAHHIPQFNYRKWIVIVMAVPLAVLAAAIHTTGTGWILYDYGESYAQGFYHAPGEILLSVLIFFALIDFLFKEDNQF